VVFLSTESVSGSYEAVDAKDIRIEELRRLLSSALAENKALNISSALNCYAPQPSIEMLDSDIQGTYEPLQFTETASQTDMPSAAGGVFSMIENHDPPDTTKVVPAPSMLNKADSKDSEVSKQAAMTFCLNESLQRQEKPEGGYERKVVHCVNSVPGILEMAASGADICDSQKLHLTLKQLEELERKHCGLLREVHSLKECQSKLHEQLTETQVRCSAGIWSETMIVTLAAVVLERFARFC
jgi:regulator of replication initiation timing